MKKKTVKLLESALSACFIMPKGDPNASNLYPAACITKALMNEGYNVDEVLDADGEWIKDLRGRNLYKRNFMKEAK